MVKWEKRKLDFGGEGRRGREFKANGLVKEKVCGCLAEEEFVCRKVPGNWKSFLEVEKTIKLR